MPQDDRGTKYEVQSIVTENHRLAVLCGKRVLKPARMVATILGGVSKDSTALLSLARLAADSCAS